MQKERIPDRPGWKIDPAININRVSLEDVKFVFTQAEKRLDDTMKTGDGITEGKDHHFYIHE